LWKYIKIINLRLAWTDASPKSDCPIDPATINPKCGTLPSIAINAGVNGEFALTVSECGSATGAIDLTPTGGTGPYTYLWTTTDGSDLSGQNTNQDLTALLPGTYSVKITDANKCVTNKSRTITATTPPTALVAKTNVTCNAANDGTITVSAPTGGSGTYDYRLNSGVWQSSGVFTGLAPNPYSVQIRDKVYIACFNVLGDQIISQPNILSASVDKTQPTCNGTDDGIITISSPAVGSGSWQYSINGGTTWTATLSNTGLAPGTYDTDSRYQPPDV
jgi:hypothetical protein